ncbi:unnamed protein product [Ascophyllum nodosum]
MGIISSKSPMMAYFNGELWVSAHDEAGRRCWFNNATGERIYRFIEGNPVFSASANSQVISTNSNETVSFIAHGMQNPVHAVNVAPSAVPQMMHPGGAAMAPLPYQTVATVATPATERGIKIGGKEEYYIRSTYKKGSWMWK